MSANYLSPPMNGPVVAKVKVSDAFEVCLVAPLAVVLAQLVQRLLLTPEIIRSNPNIGKVLSTNCKLNRKYKN